MTDRRTFGQQAALVAQAAVLLLPAALTTLPAYVVLAQGPDDWPEWLWLLGALVVAACSLLLVSWLAAGDLPSDNVAGAGIAMLFVPLPGFAVGAAWLEREPCYGDCDLGMVYGALGAIVALGLVPVGLVLFEFWRRGRSGPTNATG